MELQRKLVENKNLFSLFSAIDAANGVLRVSLQGELLLVRTLDCRKVEQMSELEKECYGVVVDVKSRKLLSYMGKEPYVGADEGRLVLIEHVLQRGHSNVSYEEDYDGIFISFYYWKGKWMAATRDCADVREGQPELWADVEAVLVELLPENTYLAVLVGGRWSKVVRYGSLELRLLAVRRQKDHCLVNAPKNLRGLLPATQLAGYERLEEDNAEFKVPKSGEECEAVRIGWKGVRVRLDCGGIDERAILFPTEAYRYHNNLMRYISSPLLRFVALYKDSLLYNSVHLFPEEASFEFGGVRYATHDMMYALFHTLASELFQIFKKCVNLNSGRYERKGLLEKLPPGYRRMVRLTKQRMNRFKRLHYPKFTYRYIIDLLKEKNDLVQLEQLLAERPGVKAGAVADISIHCSRLREVELLIAALNNKN